MNKYQEVFKKIDHDMNGFINTDQMMKVLSERINDEERLKMIVDAMDIDNNGKIYWNEFLATLISKEIVFKHENLKEVFDNFDIHKKGYFDVNDFQEAVCQIGNISVVKDEIPKLFEEAFKKDKIYLKDLEDVIYYT